MKLNKGPYVSMILLLNRCRCWILQFWTMCAEEWISVLALTDLPTDLPTDAPTDGIAWRAAGLNP